MLDVQWLLRAWSAALLPAILLCVAAAAGPSSNTNCGGSITTWLSLLQAMDVATPRNAEMKLLNGQAMMQGSNLAERSGAQRCCYDISHVQDTASQRQYLIELSVKQRRQRAPRCWEQIADRMWNILGNSLPGFQNWVSRCFVVWDHP